MAMLVAALEDKPNDYLGLLFMQMELYNSWRGQFSHLMNSAAYGENDY